MKCTKLTDEERAFWEGMIEFDYKYSPLRNDMTQEAYECICLVYRAILDDDFEWLHEIIGADPERNGRCKDNTPYQEFLERAYEHAVAAGDAGSCCNLANMYHNTKNQGTDEEYATAVELYELGASRGDDQSSINLGYIYYYGRGTQVDYARAYQCFAQGALLTGNPEGYWKLGDLYASGKGVTRSDLTAWILYSKAYENAGNSPIAARAAHHMADYLLVGIEGKLEPDPEGAFALYAEAELGYYKLIDGGLTYYQHQLEQSIEGQAKAREAIQEKHRRIRTGE